MKLLPSIAACFALALAGLAANPRPAAAQGPPPPGRRAQPGVPQKPSAAIPLDQQPQQYVPPPMALSIPASTVLPPAVHRAHVEFTGDLLTVNADNSSLNQILAEIAHKTGIRIIGGVNDERVFGTYGPSDLSGILTILLDGTGSNMMLSGDDPAKPKLLTLTPRLGGPSPPGPPQASDDDDDQPPQLSPRTAADPIGQPHPPIPPRPQPYRPPLPPQALAPTPDATVPVTGQPTAGTTTEQSPNGVKTPQQIYDELMKLQSQQPRAPK